MFHYFQDRNCVLNKENEQQRHAIAEPEALPSMNMKNL